MPQRVAILIFDEVEVLDFAGPFEVFGVTGAHDEVKPFEVYTVAERSTPVIARNGLSINPNYTVHNCPEPDIIVVPGGRGTRREMHNTVLREWITAHAGTGRLTLSVCTGSLVLAAGGLLNGLSATTHHSAFGELAEIAPTVTIRRDQRYVDNGQIVTSAGISAGIDMALYIVARLLGPEKARQTAAYMEYNWRETEAR